MWGTELVGRGAKQYVCLRADFTASLKEHNGRL
jgi:hypothetical protein